MVSAPSGYVSINEAATLLNVKPWDVVRLIKDEKVAAVELVELDSLRRFQESNQ